MDAIGRTSASGAQRHGQSTRDLTPAQVGILPGEDPWTLADQMKERAEELESTLRRLKETQNQLITEGKIASLRNLVAGVAHEMNTPIGALISAADVSSRCIDTIVGALQASPGWDEPEENGSFREALELLRVNTRLTVMASDRLAAIVRNLENFAHPVESEFQKVDLNDGLDNTLALIQHELEGKAEVVKEYGDIPAVSGCPNRLNEVFLNLLVNASQAIENKGMITIKTSRDDNGVRVQIADTGRGIPPENIERIFDPGFTDKGVGVGIGLGLPTSYSIVQEHHGHIEVESTPGKGSVFTLTFPIESVEQGDGRESRAKIRELAPWSPRQAYANDRPKS